jgi:dTDP-4-amino-4,6-dideoxyglucose
MKAGIDDLAIFGGRPHFAVPAVVGRPNTGDRHTFVTRVCEILDRERLTNDGPVVREFEQRLSEHLGVRHCVATSNATVGLQLAFHALGITGEVIVPSLTFVASAHAARWLGLTLVFCDVELETGNIDPGKVESVITPQTTGIVGVHLWSRPCAVRELEEIADRYCLRLIFDAAHAFGCSLYGRKIGGFGNAEVFSFHATKVVNALEGGAVTTNSDGLARRLRWMRNFGMDVDRRVVGLGTNAKMNEISAAMGLTSLEAFPETVKRNRENYYEYCARLARVPHVSVVEFDPTEVNNYCYVVVLIDEAASGISRDLLIRTLHSENIIAQAYFSPGVHSMEPYRQADTHLPVTDHIASRVVALPTGPSTSIQDVCDICRLIEFVVANGFAITRRHPAVLERTP